MAGVDGIPCTIRSSRVHGALRDVFAAIQRYPSDWRRLRGRLQCVCWLPREDEGTLGEWVVDPDAVAELVRPDDPRTWRFQGYEHYIAPGRIALSRRAARLPALRLLALVAHECGHAVARARDVEARERTSGDSEWASELCADMYAFRWGFEGAIRTDVPFRRLGHHAVLPGETILLGGTAFRVDRRFFLRRCP